MSFDARNGGSTRLAPGEIDKRDWENRGGWFVDLLCSWNGRPRKAIAWADGTSRRASGWAGEKVAHS